MQTITIPEWANNPKPPRMIAVLYRLRSGNKQIPAAAGSTHAKDVKMSMATIASPEKSIANPIWASASFT
jgi:hypothetical protein